MEVQIMCTRELSTEETTDTPTAWNIDIVSLLLWLLFDCYICGFRISIIITKQVL